MKTISLKTNIHCFRCIRKVAKVLDKEKDIQNWEVATENPDKILTITGKNIDATYIIQLIQKAGFEGRTYVNHQAKKQQEVFWIDIHIWKRSSWNTFNCLIGCSIGDFGTIIFLQAYYPQTSLSLQMLFAVIAGLCSSILLETFILKMKEHFSWKQSFFTAFSMSFISMIGMEISMNLTDFMITGGKAEFSSMSYWFALIIAMMVGFLMPLPYNYYKLKKFNKACH